MYSVQPQFQFLSLHHGKRQLFWPGVEGFVRPQVFRTCHENYLQDYVVQNGEGTVFMDDLLVCLEHSAAVEFSDSHTIQTWPLLSNSILT